MSARKQRATKTTTQKGPKRKAPKPNTQKQLIRRGPARLHPVAAGLHVLSPCSVHYMQALVAPFGLNSEACIPDLHAVDSKKAKIVTRGTFETSSTTGVGWIIVNPWTADSSGPLGHITTSSYTGTSATVITGGTGTLPFAGSKFPYPSSAWTNNVVSHRIVGVGLRVRYSGIELYRGGRGVMLRMPENKDVYNYNSVDNLFSYSQAKTFPVTRDWITVAYKPVAPNEYEYSHIPQAAGDTGARFSLAFGVTGTAGPTTNSALFEFEVVTFVEYVGEIDSISRSHSDVVGMSEIRNADMDDKPTRHPGKTLWRRMASMGNEIIKKASPMVQESISQSFTNRVMSGILDAGRGAVDYLKGIPAKVESSTVCGGR